jgi:hypothetical protein
VVVLRVLLFYLSLNVSNSEYYVSYAFQSASISQNETTSPEGLQNAAELIEDSSNDNHFFRISNLSWTSGTDVVFSIYLKENTRRYARLRFDNSGGNTRAWLDLRTGETTFIDATDSGVCTSVDVEVCKPPIKEMVLQESMYGAHK